MNKHYDIYLIKAGQAKCARTKLTRTSALSLARGMVSNSDEGVVAEVIEVTTRTDSSIIATFTRTNPEASGRKTVRMWRRT